MTVSVCIPTYNSARFVRECLESVLAQSYQDFEIVVSDNASTDDTGRIVQSFSDPRIRLCRLDQNRGLAFNFNNAVSLAQGEYIKVLCSDDLLDPTCLEEQAGMLARHPEIVMATSGIRFVDGTGRVLRTESWFSREVVLRDVDIVAGSLIYGNVVGPPSAVLVRRESLFKAGPFSDAFPQFVDVEMWMRLAALGPVGYLPGPLCAFRLHSQAMTEELRKLGAIRNDVLRITDMMLRSVTPSPMARRVAWGRAAGSFLKQAAFGMRYGYIEWPLTAVWKACQIDPAFVGLMMHQVLFRPGLFGLRAKENRALTVCPLRTPRN